MKERIKSILDLEQISPAKFADIIGVQRSSMSHILSGRNNPGFDFIHNLLIRFPHINADWLLTGRGKMIKENQGILNFDQSADNKLDIDKNSVLHPHENSIFEGSVENSTKNRVLRKIIMVYDDNTFEEILPFSVNWRFCTIFAAA